MSAQPGGVLPLTLPTAAPAAFDLLGPLPQGTTLLEASAGTGKTFTVAALATRYVAEGRAGLDELLLVTFGRAATSELRERVRARLTLTHDRLRGPAPHTDEDPLVAHLAGVDPEELTRRRDRLTRALADFDAATIATTHGFCQQMLTRLGVLADVDPDAVMVGDVADLAAEAVDDVYLRRYASVPGPAPLTVAEARSVARAAMSDPFARLDPADAAPGSTGRHRVELAGEVRREVARRKRERRLLDYDDLLVRLRDALFDPVVGEQAAGRLRQRYRVVMVDEFQDTDPVQWQILHRAFHGQATMVLIGDPKQAIYAFRGGDVVTYLTAREDAGTEATLDRNWRSDPVLLQGLEHVFAGAALGDPRIVVHPVRPGRPDGRTVTGPGTAPVRIRQVLRAAHGLRGTRVPRMDAARALVVRDVAAEVVRCLQEARVDAGAGGQRPARPGDIAVLTRRNADALAVQDALAGAGVPAVVSGLSSVFATPAARHWVRLLDALADPGHGGRTATLALTPFIGWDATRLAGAGEQERDELAGTVRRWAALLAERGVGALLEATAAHGLVERVTAAGGERLLTDVRHIGQSLQQAEAVQRLGVAGLGDWLRERTGDAQTEYAEELSRRLETDAAAVQVLTVHASKGLEFPIVFVPFGWDRYEPRDPAELRLHDDSGSRVLHVGGPGSEQYSQARRQHDLEERGEDLRLLYVALTRAAGQVVLWWSPSYNSSGGAVTRLLLADRIAGEQPDASVRTDVDDAVTARLQALVDRSDGSVVLEAVDAEPEARSWPAPPAAPAQLRVARWGRGLDGDWRRLSYSALTAGAHAAAFDTAPGAPAGSEPEGAGTLDEPALPEHPDGGAPAAGPGSHRLCPLGDLPAGAAFGTLVHDVLEQLDPALAGPDGSLAPVLHELAAARSGGQLEPGRLDVLAAGLDLALATPLGPLADGRALRDVPVRDRLSELEFELPLAGGDRPGAGPGGPRRAADLRAVADLVRRHLPADDPLAGYPERLAALAEDEPTLLRGYLTGSIDAVLRVGTAQAPRYLVVDYKTNRLAPPEEPLTVWHYRPEALAEAMIEAHYPLQLLLYQVALHRFLRWRQPGYDPDRHLGGGLYLFLRGMCSIEQTEGVMGWSPPVQLVVGLSALLDGRSVA